MGNPAAMLRSSHMSCTYLRDRIVGDKIATPHAGLVTSLSSDYLCK